MKIVERILENKVVDNITEVSTEFFKLIYINKLSKKYIYNLLSDSYISKNVLSTYPQ